MLNRDNDGLQIFWSFVVDKKLPKYTKKTPDKNNSFLSPDEMDWSVGSIGSNPDSGEKPSIFKVIFKRLYKNWKVVIEKKKFPPQAFFTLVKGSILTDTFDKKLYEKRVEGYLQTIKQAKSAGQTSLVETLQSKLNTVHNENLLYASGNVTTITEEQVVEFYKKSEKGLRLDWIKNFNRVIPSKIVDAKLELDKLGVFDNYVIMHYDPNKKSWKETQEELEKRKDPILFGVIKNINKLYYIGDWEDEFCNLTLNDFIDEFGKDGIDKNNITVNIK